MYKRILLAYDGSEAGQKALLECRELAQWSQCEIELVAVMPSMMAFVGLEGGVYDVELEAREKSAEIRARAASDHTEYTVGDRSLKRESLVELRRWASQLRSRIARRKNGGRVPMVSVSFTRRGLA